MTIPENDRPRIPYIVGTFQHVLHPPRMAAARRTRPGGKWYINDHCFLVDDAGTIHWYGITNPYPPSADYYAMGTHRHIGHASAKSPFGPWQEHDHALALPEDTKECIGACFVAKHGGQYVMLNGYSAGFDIAVSDDLFAWKKLDRPKVDLGAGSRDPCIIRHEGGYLLYGCAETAEKVGVTATAFSTNLIDWAPQPPALVSDLKFAVLESPFVLRRGEWHYLFINHSHRQYEETIVFASRDPRRFDWSSPLCTLFAHAAEILEFGGRTYISHCGIEDRHWEHVGAPYGLWLAELKWM